MERYIRTNTETSLKGPKNNKEYILERTKAAITAMRRDREKVIIQKTEVLTSKGRTVDVSNPGRLMMGEYVINVSGVFLDTLSCSVDENGQKEFSALQDPEHPTSPYRHKEILAKFLSSWVQNVRVNAIKFNIPREFKGPARDLSDELLIQTLSLRDGEK